MSPGILHAHTMPSTTSKLPEISRASLIAIRILALIALSVSGYLAWVTLTFGTIAACDGQASHLACDHVLRSSWSRWLDVPVSLFGCAVYSLILLASWAIGPQAGRYRSAGWFGLRGLVTLAVGSALWFLGLQVFVIGKFCLFCLGIHLCGILIGALLIVSAVGERRRQVQAAYLALLRRTTLSSSLSPTVSLEEDGRRGRGVLWPVAMALLVLLLLVTGQIFFPSTTFEVRNADTFTATTAIGNEQEGLDSLAGRFPLATRSADSSVALGVNVPSADPFQIVGHDNVAESDTSSLTVQGSATASPESNSVSDVIETRRISLLDGKLNLDVYQHSVLGSPEAEHVIVELVDYTCKECRRLHHYMKQARAHYGDRLAIVVLPVPLDPSCNPHVQGTHPDHVEACKYARLALAVASIDPQVFSEFHDWLMESKSPPPLQDAVRKASEFVDPELIKVKINGDGVRQRMQAYMHLYKRVGKFPATIVGDGILVGVPNNSNEFLDTIDSRLGIWAVP